MTEGFAIEKVIYGMMENLLISYFWKVNEAFEKHTGIKRDKIIGKTALELFPDTEPVWLKKYREVMTTGKPTNFQERFRPLNRWMDVHAFMIEPGKMGVIFSDITDKKKAENELKRHAALLNVSNEAIFSWEFNGSILSWNQGAERLYGYSKKEAVGF